MSSARPDDSAVLALIEKAFGPLGRQYAEALVDDGYDCNESLAALAAAEYDDVMCELESVVPKRGHRRAMADALARWWSSVGARVTASAPRAARIAPPDDISVEMASTLSSVASAEDESSSGGGSDESDAAEEARLPRAELVELAKAKFDHLRLQRQEQPFFDYKAIFYRIAAARFETNGMPADERSDPQKRRERERLAHDQQAEFVVDIVSLFNAPFGDRPVDPQLAARRCSFLLIGVCDNGDINFDEEDSDFVRQQDTARWRGMLERIEPVPLVCAHTFDVACRDTGRSRSVMLIEIHQRRDTDLRLANAAVIKRRGATGQLREFARFHWTRNGASNYACPRLDDGDALGSIERRQKYLAHERFEGNAAARQQYWTKNVVDRCAAPRSYELQQALDGALLACERVAQDGAPLKVLLLAVDPASTVDERLCETLAAAEFDVVFAVGSATDASACVALDHVCDAARAKLDVPEGNAALALNSSLWSAVARGAATLRVAVPRRDKSKTFATLPHTLLTRLVGDRAHATTGLVVVLLFDCAPIVKRLLWVPALARVGELVLNDSADVLFVGAALDGASSDETAHCVTDWCGEIAAALTSSAHVFDVGSLNGETVCRVIEPLCARLPRAPQSHLRFSMWDGTTTAVRRERLPSDVVFALAPQIVANAIDEEIGVAAVPTSDDAASAADDDAASAADDADDDTSDVDDDTSDVDGGSSADAGDAHVGAKSAATSADSVSLELFDAELSRTREQFLRGQVPSDDLERWLTVFAMHWRAKRMQSDRLGVYVTRDVLGDLVRRLQHELSESSGFVLVRVRSLPCSGGSTCAWNALLHFHDRIPTLVLLRGDASTPARIADVLSSLFRNEWLRHRALLLADGWREDEIGALENHCSQLPVVIVWVESIRGQLPRHRQRSRTVNVGPVLSAADMRAAGALFDAVASNRDVAQLPVALWGLAAFGHEGSLHAAQRFIGAIVQSLDEEGAAVLLLLAVVSYGTRCDTPAQLCRWFWPTHSAVRWREFQNSLHGVIEMCRPRRVRIITGAVTPIVGRAAFQRLMRTECNDDRWVMCALLQLRRAIELARNADERLLRDVREIALELFADSARAAPPCAVTAQRAHAPRGSAEALRGMTPFVALVLGECYGAGELLEHVLFCAETFGEAQMRARHGALLMSDEQTLLGSDESLECAVFGALSDCIAVEAAVDQLDPTASDYAAKEVAFASTTAGDIVRQILRLYARLRDSSVGARAACAILRAVERALDARQTRLDAAAQTDDAPALLPDVASAHAAPSVIAALERGAGDGSVPLDVFFNHCIVQLVRWAEAWYVKGSLLRVGGGDRGGTAHINTFAHVGSIKLSAGLIEAAFHCCAGRSRARLAELLRTADESVGTAPPLKRIVARLGGKLSDLEREMLHYPLTRGDPNAVLEMAQKPVVHALALVLNEDAGSFDAAYDDATRSLGRPLQVSLVPFICVYERRSRAWSEVTRDRRLRAWSAIERHVDLADREQCASLPSFFFNDAILLLGALARFGERKKLRTALIMLKTWSLPRLVAGRDEPYVDARALFWRGVLLFAQLLNGEPTIGARAVSSLLERAVCDSSPSSLLSRKRRAVLTCRGGAQRIAMLDSGLHLDVSETHSGARFVGRGAGTGARVGWLPGQICKGARTGARALQDLVWLSHESGDIAMSSDYYVRIAVGDRRFAVGIAAFLANRLGASRDTTVAAYVVVGFRYSSGAWVETAMARDAFERSVFFGDRIPGRKAASE